MKEKRLPLRVALLLGGSAVMGCGIGLAVVSGAGCDPLAVLWDGLSHSFSISITTANMITAACLLLLIVLVDYRQLHVGTIVYQLVMSACCEGVLRLVSTPAAFWPGLLLAALGVALTGLGAGIYAAAAIGKGPYEGAVFGLCRRFGWRISRVRMMMDALFLLAGILLGGTFGLGTVLAVLGIGPLIELTVGRVQKLFHLPSPRQS